MQVTLYISFFTKNELRIFKLIIISENLNIFCINQLYVKL